jgi:hypothetical protein
MHGENQASPVLANNDVEQAVLAIVGDLAAYRPRAKVVIFEGGGDSELDVRIATRLFPLLAQKMNFVPGGDRRRVKDLYAVLSDAATRAGLSERFFAVVDRDRGDFGPPAGAAVKRWDRYHIENYLLDEGAIRAAVIAVLGRDVFAGEWEVTAALKECAATLVNRLILERMQDEINEGLVRELRVGASPDTSAPSNDLKPSIVGSVERIGIKGTTFASDEWLQTAEELHRTALESALASDGWLAEFPGRQVLAAFAGRYVPGISYEVLRNVVLDKMVESKTEPEGLKIVLEAIAEE